MSSCDRKEQILTPQSIGPALGVDLAPDGMQVRLRAEGLQTLEAGKCRSIAKIAEAEKIDRSFVSRLLDLTLLAPDIQEAILEGRQAKGMQLEELTRAVPGVWEEQRLLARPETGDANPPGR